MPSCCLCSSAVLLLLTLAGTTSEANGGTSSSGATTLGIASDGTGFTIDGSPAFLTGVSYFASGSIEGEALASDLHNLTAGGFNWVRLWVTWEGYGALGRDGRPVEPYMSRLLSLLRELEARGIVADLTMARGAAAASGGFPTQAAHLIGVRTLATATMAFRNVYFDLANEHNIQDDRYVSGTEMGALVRAVKAVDPARIVTASTSGGGHTMGTIDPVEALDFLAVHLPRHKGCANATAALVRNLTAAMAPHPRIPLHLQEPFRRDYSPSWNPEAADFVTDLAAAKEAQAAGWCLHNGGNRHATDGRPFRSFNMSTGEGRLWAQWDPVERQVLQQIQVSALKADPSEEALGIVAKSDDETATASGLPRRQFQLLHS